MKVNKNWNDIMFVIDIMFATGYTVSMANTKRWLIDTNDYQLYNNLPTYSDEFRGKNTELTNLECACEIIDEFLKWFETNITTYTDFLSKEKIDFYKLIKPFCHD